MGVVGLRMFILTHVNCIGSFFEVKEQQLNYTKFGTLALSLQLSTSKFQMVCFSPMFTHENALGIVNFKILIIEKILILTYYFLKGFFLKILPSARQKDEIQIQMTKS